MTRITHRTFAAASIYEALAGHLWQKTCLQALVAIFGKIPHNFCHLEAERSDAERPMYFFDSAIAVCYDFMSKSNTALAQKSFHAIALG